MAVPNSERRRKTVELGKAVTEMVYQLRHNGRLRERYHLHGWGINDSVVIRLAVYELYRLLFPGTQLGLINPCDLGGNVAALK
jgi:hypothetical protein